MPSCIIQDCLYLVLLCLASLCSLSSGDISYGNHHVSVKDNGTALRLYHCRAKWGYNAATLPWCIKPVQLYGHSTYSCLDTCPNVTPAFPSHAMITKTVFVCYTTADVAECFSSCKLYMLSANTVETSQELRNFEVVPIKPVSMYLSSVSQCVHSSVYIEWQSVFDFNTYLMSLSADRLVHTHTPFNGHFSRYIWHFPSPFIPRLCILSGQA